MRTVKLFTAVAFVGTIIMTSCNANDEITDNSSAGEVKFTSAINATPQTKAAIDGAGNSVWETGDPVGIYMVNNGTATVIENVSNIKYTAASANAATSFLPAGTTIYYPTDESMKVDFIAYHPQSMAVADFIYPINLSNQSSQTAIDLMWAKADNSASGYDKNNEMSGTAVSFSFDHQLVKLIFTVAAGTGAPVDLSTMTVSINGMNTTASFDLKGVGGLTSVGSSVNITPFKQIGVYTYEAILLPVATLGGNHTVTFNVGGETYTWVMSNEINSLDSGKIYTYDITLTKHQVYASGSINKWIVGSTGTGVAE